ncbi:hypothetical protein M3N64_04660 [Sporolactobacillus sp. CPB3-1]|uniref:Uncharacterized protein n=1 Tax=Sporolactobacillus mangiferae TaxID=2940498 RepID=A0ABT0M8N8_9BACL|nr:hypothetical protein [Sporolactobacillus mangiferae]MCL1631239.1 hypothetical protein [Sporolactobacillus mangiferae]
MCESYLDQLGNFLGIGVTMKERKRAKYLHLYHKFSMSVPQAERDLSEINRMIMSAGTPRCM